MIPIIGDIESYYSREYSLSRMTTQEYILHPEFEVICVSIQVGWSGIPQRFTGTMEDTKKWLVQFDWGNALFIAHNAMFDAAILAWIFDIHPKMLYCTMQGARPFMCPFTPRGRMSLAILAEYAGLGQKGREVIAALGKHRVDFTPTEMRGYQGYCDNDVVLCAQLAKLQIPKLPKDELMLIHLNLVKYTQPQIYLDGEVLRTALAKHLLHKKAILAKAHVSDASLLRSNNKFAAVLKLFSVKPPTKISPKTGKVAFAFAKTDPGMKALLEHDNEDIQLLAAARLSEKSTQAETRLRRFIDIRSTAPWFAVPLLYYGAHTGRMSGLNKLNMQNLARRSELRRALMAPPGHKMVVGDLSQIEARVLAVLAGQSDLVKAFAAGEDVYCKFASVLFDRVITKADFDERFLGKTSILGAGFGVGPEKFYATALNGGANITISEAARTIELYRRTYWKIPELWKEAGKWLKFMAQGGSKNFTIKYSVLNIHTNFQGLGPAIELPNGMPIFYPGLTRGADNQYTYTSREGPKKIWGGGMVENVVQALARIVIFNAELFLAKRGYRACLSIHDELVYIVKDGIAENFATVLDRVLTQRVSWMPELPLAAEVNVGDNYKECK